ncbi:MAG: cation:proton antiporter, partial [Chloroflexi bacterium]|nr:cation:proton antiporter [Chloroflexota bacterium]
MEVFDALLAIGLLLMLAKLLEGLFKRIGINAIFAYAIAGVILGPVTGLVEPNRDIQLLLNIGIFVFFFLVGLDELDISGFISAVRGRLFVAAVLSVVISMVGSLLVTTDVLFDVGLGLGFTDALAVAGVLSLSSLGIVAKVLIDEECLKEPVGIQIFTGVVIAELLILFIVGFAISEHAFLDTHGQFEAITSVGLLLGQLAAFTVVTWLVCNKIIPRLLVLLHKVLQVPQLSYGLLLGGLFLIIVLAEEVGLHGSLGALLFGAALAPLPYQLRHDSMPGMRSTAEGLFVPLFFASAGLNFNLAFLELSPQVIAALIFVPLAAKFAGAFFSAYITRLEAPFAVASGLMAKGVAEIALLLVMLHAHIIDEALFSLLVVIMFGYILLTPIGISFALRRTRHSEEIADDSEIPHMMDRFVLSGIHVQDVLDHTRVYPHHEITVRSFIDNWTTPEQHDYVVVDDENLAGIVSLSFLRYLPRGQWGNTKLEDILRKGTPTAPPDELVEDTLQRMLESSLTVFPVVDPETQEFQGSISSYEIMEMIVLTAGGRDI